MQILFLLYKRFLSPMIHAFSKLVGGNPYSGCRFEPTCSVYCETALKTHGWIKGGLKSIYRISRCHPLSGPGGYDPL